MRFVLDFLYALTLLVAAPWLVYSVQRDRAWAAVAQRLGRRFDAPSGSVWLHGSSVGEIGLLAPLIELLETSRPDIRLLITSFTGTGIAAARTRYARHTVLPCPLDFSFVTRRLIRRVSPAAVVIVESDIWPNFLHSALAESVPVVVVNAKMSARSFRRYGCLPFLAPLFRRLHAVGAQTEEHARRFVDVGVPAARVVVTGNMKYDLTVDTATADRRAEMRRALGMEPGDTCVIAASLHLPEDEAVLDAFSALAPRFPAARLVIVPRYPAEGAAIARHARARGFEPVLKSRATLQTTGGIAFGNVLVADTLGELRNLYHAADIAFVGGSLYFRGANKGGHNMMEPAILGMPVLFGPHNFSFKETVADLLTADAAVMVADRTELERTLARFLESAQVRADFGERARQVVLDRQGATLRSFALIEPLLPYKGLVAGQGTSDDNAAVRG